MKVALFLLACYHFFFGLPPQCSPDGTWVVIEKHEIHDPSMQNEPKVIQAASFEIN
jgi:hypothetical protein